MGVSRNPDRTNGLRKTAKASTGIETSERVEIRRRNSRPTLLATDACPGGRPLIEPLPLGRSLRLTAIGLDAPPAVRLPGHYRRPRKPRENAANGDR